VRYNVGRAASPPRLRPAKCDRGGSGRRSPALPSAPGFARYAEELRGHVGRPGAGRVAELLMVRLDDLGPLLEGRVRLASTALERLRRVE
jgi:hypothetical protein